MKLGPYCTDATKTLEELTGLNGGDPTDGPTYMVRRLIGAWKKPLMELEHEEVWFLASQLDGMPFILDLVWPILEKDPLYCFDKYEGDLLSIFLRAPAETWSKRPEYEASLEQMKQRALLAPDHINDMFRESLTR